MNSNRRTWALISALIAALMATVAFSVAPSTAGSTTASTTAKASVTEQDPKPTIVLVHGAWADASGWNAQIAAFQREGYPVIAPANPLRGLTSDAAHIRSVLETIDGPIVLVGHSYGGAVITNAATGVPNVKALVYIAGFVPNTGESVGQLVTQYPGTQITPAVLTERPYPLADGGQGVDLYINQDAFRGAFAADLPRRTTDLMQATQRPFSGAAFSEQSAEPAWKTIPAWYLLATDDRAIPPAAQKFMAERAHATITEVKSSHVPMQSQPEIANNTIRNAIASLN